MTLIIAVLMALGVIQSENQYDSSSTSQHQIYSDWIGDDEVGL